MACFVPAFLNDGDTYTHLAAGQWMLAHHAVPHTDPFSFTRRGASWVAHEWLAELASAVADRIAGWRCLILLFAAAAALAAGLTGRFLQRRLAAGPAALALLLGFACVAPSLLARPHLLALPVLVAWVAGLLAAVEARRRPSWALLPLMTLWANLHGGFLFGLALIPPLAVEAALVAGAERGRMLRGWGLFLLAAAIAAMLTPQGPQGLLFPFQLDSMTTLGSIGEWQPTNLRAPQPMEIGAVVLLAVLLRWRLRIPLVRLLLLLGLAWMALAHARHQLLLGVVAPLLLAAPLAAAFPVATPRRGGLWNAGGATVLALVGLLRLALPGAPGQGPDAPVAAVDAVPAGLAAQPVLNEYAFGGYLIHRGISPFVDGRADLYGDAFLMAYQRALQQDEAALQQLVSRYRIAWTILAPSDPLVALLDRLPDWRRIHADPVAVVHVRNLR